MKKPKTLFHGSKFKVEGFLEPRQANDTSRKENCLLAVYATDRKVVAEAMALSGSSPAFSDFEEEDHKIIFMHKGPKPNKKIYVYEIPNETFTETEEKHQWISKVKVPITKTYTYTAKELKNRWRLATEKEFNEKKEVFNYPKPYKEFFEGRSSKLK